MLKLLLIFLGAGLGGVLRYLLAHTIHTAANSAFPFGTLVVNITGCLAIGFLAALFEARSTGPSAIPEHYRLALIVGVLGGYTTFSAFGYESMKLITDHKWMLAGLYIFLSNALGLAAVFIGAALASLLPSTAS